MVFPDNVNAFFPYFFPIIAAKESPKPRNKTPESFISKGRNNSSYAFYISGDFIFHKEYEHPNIKYIWVAIKLS